METFTEILFDKRNKEYGSYVLRTKYGKRLMTSMMIGFLFLGSVLAYPLISSYYNKSHSISDLGKNVGVDIISLPKEDFTPPPPPPASVDVKVTRFIAPNVVDEDITENNMMSQDDLANVGPSPAPITEEIVIQEQTQPPTIEVPKEQPVFTVVEEQPYLNGMYEFLSQNIKYPEEAKELGIQGKVFVTFVVESDGSISNVKVLRGIGGGCDEEAIRVVQSMPKWSPGKQRGTAVRVQFNLPVKFTLN